MPIGEFDDQFRFAAREMDFPEDLQWLSIEGMMWHGNLGALLDSVIQQLILLAVVTNGTKRAAFC